MHAKSNPSFGISLESLTSKVILVRPFSDALFGLPLSIHHESHIHICVNLDMSQPLILLSNQDHTQYQLPSPPEVSFSFAPVIEGIHSSTK